MLNQKQIICRYSLFGRDEAAPLPEKPGNGQEWCRPGGTCNRPSDPMRDDLGLTELEERLSLNHNLLSSWNRWMRSPYCQCTYSIGNPPVTGSCRHCGPTHEPGVGQGTAQPTQKRLSRIRTNPQIPRRAHLDCGIRIHGEGGRVSPEAPDQEATAPEPEGQLPSYGKHNLRALWEQLPTCAKHGNSRGNAGYFTRSEQPPCNHGKGETVAEIRPA